MGRELRPRVGPIDLKLHTLRWGMTGLAMLDAIITWKAYSEGTLTPALMVVSAGHALSVADYIFFEVNNLVQFPGSTLF